MWFFSFTQVISRKQKPYLDLLCKLFRVFVAGGANFLDENSNMSRMCQHTLKASEPKTCAFLKFIVYFKQ